MATKRVGRFVRRPFALFCFLLCWRPVRLWQPSRSIRCVWLAANHASFSRTNALWESLATGYTAPLWVNLQMLAVLVLQSKAKVTSKNQEI